MSSQSQQPDLAKQKLIQQQLVLLLHAERCQKSGEEYGERSVKCTLPQCRTMKAVLNHLTDCKMDKGCSMPHCSSSRQILAHWKSCNRAECLVCSSLRSATSANKNNGQENVATPSSSTMSIQTNQQLAQNFPNHIQSGAEKQKLIHQQLALLLHAERCQKRENDNPGVKCTLEHCVTMKEVLDHLAHCEMDKECSVPHCSSSRQILVHWKNCNRVECLVCSPLRPTKNDNTANPPMTDVQSNDPLQSLVSDIVDGLQSMSMHPLPQISQSHVETFFDASDPDISELFPINTPNDQYQSLNVPATKDWQRLITLELRNHLVKKLVHAIFPNPDPAFMVHKRWDSLLAYAKKIEADVYSMANSRSDYYHLLAEKIFRMQKELREKCENRREQIAMSNATATASPQASQNQMENVEPLDGDGDECNDQGKPLFVTGTKDWHNSVTCDLRNHLVHKLVQGMSPDLPPDSSHGTRWENVVTHAKEIERDFYVVADSRAEYYNLVAQKIYEIQKELEIKRENRRKQQMALNYGATTSAMAIALDQSERAISEQLNQLKSNASNLNTNNLKKENEAPIQQDDPIKVNDEIDDDWMIIDNEQ